MNFFDLSDGKSATETDGSFDSNPTSEPIPEGTLLEVIIETAKWDEPFNVTEDGDRVIKIRWSVLRPSEHEARKVFQTIRHYAVDDKKRNNARKMFAAIDNNAGGKVAKLVMEENRDPTDEDLSRCLENHIMKVTVGVYNGKNFVRAVEARNKPGTSPAPKKEEKPQGSLDTDIDF